MSFLSTRQRASAIGILVLASTGFTGQVARAAENNPADSPKRSQESCGTNHTSGKTTCAPNKPLRTRRGLSAAAAFVPGLAVHGAGHFVTGQTRTGLALLGAEGLGVALVLGGLGGTAATGATRRFISPMILGIAAGTALLVIPALADIYGILAPEGGTGSPLLVLPSIETQLGLAYVHDPNFAYSLFLNPGVDVRVRSFRFSTSAYFALDDVNARARAAFAHRFFGPRPQGMTVAKDGSYLDVEFALTHHAYASNGFSVTTGELNVNGRLDLEHVGPTLQGSFAELALGIAYAAHRYGNIDTEVNDLLTPRFAFGMYVGHSGYPRGEVAAYYDHRHDGFAGGLKSRGLGSGIAGHFGLAGRVYASRTWGVTFDASAGSAYMGQLGVLFRYGVRP